MKKVLFVATVDIHIKSFHIPYLKMLKEMNYEVHVATNGTEDFPYCDKKHTICIERSPYKINNIKAVVQLRKILEKENFDIIHCHTPMGSVVTRIAAKNVRKKGTKVIYTAHGFHFYKGAPIINWVLFYPIEKILSKYTDTLITINKEDYNLALKKFKKTNVKYVQGVGIDTKKFNFNMTKKEQDSLKRSLGLDKNDFILLFAARLDKNKNQEFLINVMEKLVKKYKNIHLLLPGRDELNGYYQKIVDKKNLHKNIHFLGLRNDIPQLLKISNVIVSSSLREGLPVNIIEALLCGKPVVATRCRGMDDLITNDLNGYLIDVKKTNEFKSAIEKLYLDKKTYNRISSNTNKNINKFDIENVLDLFKTIYTKE